MNKHFFKIIFFLFVSLLIFPMTLLADKEIPHALHPTPSDKDRIYVKIDIYKIGPHGPTTMCSFDWNDDSHDYMTEDCKKCEDASAFVIIGPWPKQEPNTETSAIAFYKGCSVIKRYSTPDIVRLGFKDPKNVVKDAIHHSVFNKIKGFRAIGIGVYAFDVITEEGSEMSFDVSTGNLRTSADEKRDREIFKNDLPEYLKPQCESWHGILTTVTSDKGEMAWVCKAADGKIIEYWNMPSE